MLLVGLIIVALIIGGYFGFIALTQKYKIVSTKGSSEVIVYLAKSDANAKTITSLVNRVKSDAKNNKKIKPVKGQVVTYNIKVFDDKTIAENLVHHTTVLGATKSGPTIVKDQVMQAQKAMQDHLIFTASSNNAWQVIYGPNYQYLKPAPVATPTLSLSPVPVPTAPSPTLNASTKPSTKSSSSHGPSDSKIF